MNRIYELRKGNNLNQTALAKKLGISQSTLSYWERGDYEPDIESIIKIADLFKVSTDFLLGKTDDPSLPETKKDPHPGYEGLDPVEDRGFFKVSAEAKKAGLNEHDLRVAVDFLKRARQMDEESGKKKNS